MRLSVSLIWTFEQRDNEIWNWWHGLVEGMLQGRGWIKEVISWLILPSLAIVCIESSRKILLVERTNRFGSTFRIFVHHDEVLWLNDVRDPSSVLPKYTFWITDEGRLARRHDYVPRETLVTADVSHVWAPDGIRTAPTLTDTITLEHNHLAFWKLKLYWNFGNRNSWILVVNKINFFPFYNRGDFVKRRQS